MEHNKNNLINAAFSLYSAPGTFALLLGSGISQGAGIPTGWDITQDLIKQIAVLHDEQNIGDPESWFRTKFGIPPSYSDLIEKWGKSPVERGIILKNYIEPKEEEREEGKKIPSESHKAIAWLVKSGYIRIIITTNFDQLLESALREQGINPVVIFNENLLKGALPFQHNQCTILKLNGDYQDTRIKNTLEELAEYSTEFNIILDRIFDEYGLIVCGWSTKWDIALRDALQRRINRRFTIYWAYRVALNEEAFSLCSHLQGVPILINNADQFFVDLSEKINALTNFNQPHPLSIPLAIAQVKKYVVSQQYRIKLHDMILEEVDTLCEDLKSERFNPLKFDAKKYIECFHHRMHDYEKNTEMLINIFSNLSYFGEGKSPNLISYNIERIYTHNYRKGNSAFVDLQAYPSLLIAYSIGIASIESQNYYALADLFLKTKFDDMGRTKSMPDALNVWNVFTHDSSKMVPNESGYILIRPVNEYLFNYLKPVFYHLIPNEKRYNTSFNIFEYLIGLVYIDLEFEDISKVDWAPLGRFQPYYYRSLIRLSHESTPMNNFIQNGLSKGENWGLLKAGFFKGSQDRLKQCVEVYEKWLIETARNM